jgi:hypothetical protein
VNLAPRLRPDRASVSARDIDLSLSSEISKHWTDLTRGADTLPRNETHTQASQISSETGDDAALAQLLQEEEEELSRSHYRTRRGSDRNQGRRARGASRQDPLLAADEQLARSIQEQEYEIEPSALACLI